MAMKRTHFNFFYDAAEALNGSLVTSSRGCPLLAIPALVSNNQVVLDLWSKSKGKLWLFLSIVRDRPASLEKGSRSKRRWEGRKMGKLLM